MKCSITIKDWHWDESIKSMIFEDAEGNKYKGKTHHVVTGKEYVIETSDISPKDGCADIIRWH